MSGTPTNNDHRIEHILGRLTIGSPDALSSHDQEACKDSGLRSEQPLSRHSEHLQQQRIGMQDALAGTFSPRNDDRGNIRSSMNNDKSTGEGNQKFANSRLRHFTTPPGGYPNAAEYFARMTRSFETPRKTLPSAPNIASHQFLPSSYRAINDTLYNTQSGNAIIHQASDHSSSEMSNNGEVTSGDVIPALFIDPFSHGDTYSPTHRWNHTDVEEQGEICPIAPAALSMSSLNERTLAIAEYVHKQQLKIEQEYGPGTLSEFKPSHTVLEKYTGTPRALAIGYDGHSKYQGDITKPGNRSAEIPARENCSLWVTGLPANLTYCALLDSIRNIGKVYSSHINRPTEHIPTCAVKLVFFNRPQAEKMSELINSGSFFVMGKQITSVKWNNIKRGSHISTQHSRVIRIKGPAHIMDFEFFDYFFSCRFTYDVVCRNRVCCSEPETAIQEWHFASLRGQASSAKLAIEREMQHIFTVSWAADPCDVL